VSVDCGPRLAHVTLNTLVRKRGIFRRTWGISGITYYAISSVHSIVSHCSLPSINHILWYFWLSTDRESARRIINGVDVSLESPRISALGKPEILASFSTCFVQGHPITLPLKTNVYEPKNIKFIPLKALFGQLCIRSHVRNEARNENGNPRSQVVP
jgi:hypothetical protein